MHVAELSRNLRGRAPGHLELLVVLAAIGVGGIGAGPHIGAASICRGAAPAWVCDSFGYADRAAVSVVTPAPSHYIGESFDAPPSTYGAPSNPGSPRPYQPTNEPSTPTPDTSPPATPRPAQPPPREHRLLSPEPTPSRSGLAHAGITSSSVSVVKEPGKRSESQVPPGHVHGGDDLARGQRLAALLLPSLVCLALLLDSMHSTVTYAEKKFDGIRRFRPQASNGGGLGPPKGLPRDIRLPHRTPCDRRRRPNSSSQRKLDSSSRFLSTLGEAPLWLSMSTCTRD